MLFISSRSGPLRGVVRIPASKSHSVRANFFGLLSEGISEAIIKDPPGDAYAMSRVIREFGASVTINDDRWIFKGTGGKLTIPTNVIDVGNSGTGLFISYAIAALLDSYIIITGDDQIRYKPGRYGEPLLKALKMLGAKEAISSRGDGKPPVIIKGPIKGGYVELPGINSQWITPLLIVAPLLEKDTEIKIIDDPAEVPYLRMTLDWVERAGGKIEHDNFKYFRIKGGQRYRAYKYEIPGDWESATFVMAAAAMIEGSDVTLMGLDIRDSQGDKIVIDILRSMGADIEIKNYGIDGVRVISSRPLEGIEIDCKDIPDAIPYLTVLGTVARGKTVLRNIAPSRLKETDRPAIIKMELEKMGARIELKENEMIIYNSKLKGSIINGHMDHRIVMAASIAGLVAEGVTVVTDAEYHRKSFPTFYEVMRSIGANIIRGEEK
jgi:3-phosphoshikimate 1-carboxyvinyltransferase